MVRTDNNRVIDKYIMIKPIETSVDTVRGIDGYQIHRVVTENVVNESDFPD
jgi:hypothetical protein